MAGKRAMQATGVPNGAARQRLAGPGRQRAAMTARLSRGANRRAPEGWVSRCKAWGARWRVPSNKSGSKALAVEARD